MNQYTIFASQEADNYFLRNKDIYIYKEQNDICFQTIKSTLSLDKIHSVIELGAYNGMRLNSLKTILPNCNRFVGTELSKLAVEDGKKQYNLEMYHAPIEDFSLDETFDLVIVQGVLCWVDRENLFKAIYHIDKLVAPNGFLILGDFEPFYPQKNLYHHITTQQVYTFKQDYSQIFLAGNTYKILQKTYHCESYTQDISKENNITKILSQHDRMGISILQKNLLNYYA